MLHKHVSRRQFLAGSLAATGGLALSACVPAGAPAGGDSGDSMEASEEPVDVLFHTRLGTHADWHISRKDLFLEQNPGINLEIDELPGNEMYPKIYALSASGTVGDVVWTYLNNPPEHRAKGVLIPLDDIVAAKNFDLSNFWDSLLAALTLDGELHAIPNHGHYGTTAYYHNKTLIEESGGELPHTEWTTDDYVAMGKAVTDPPEVWGIRTWGVGQEHIPSYLRIFGGDAIDEEGTKSLLDQEGSIAGLRWLYDLQHTHEVDPCQCGDEVVNNFVAGLIGSFNTTTGLIGRFSNMKNEGDIEFDWDAVVGPVGPTGLRGSQVSAAAFGITGNSQNPSEAFQVLDFYSTKEDGIEHVFFGAGSPGGRKDVWESDELNSIHPIFRQHQQIYPEGPRKWHRPANARTSEFVDTMNNNLQAIWTQAVEFEEGVDQTHLLVQEILEKDPLA